MQELRGRQNLTIAAKRLVFSEQRALVQLGPEYVELNPVYKCLSVFLKESFS